MFVGEPDDVSLQSPEDTTNGLQVTVVHYYGWASAIWGQDRQVQSPLAGSISRRVAVLTYVAQGQTSVGQGLLIVRAVPSCCLEFALPVKFLTLT